MAPMARAAAIETPSANPPAATTGVGETRLTTSGRRTIVLVSRQLQWAPPSRPDATITSTPALTHRSAALTDGTTWTHTISGISSLRAMDSGSLLGPGALAHGRGSPAEVTITFSLSLTAGSL